MTDSSSTRRRNCCSKLTPQNFKRNFKEQTLPSWQPLYSSGSVSLAFFAVGVFFLVFGTVITVQQLQVKEVELDYTKCGDCNQVDFSLNTSDTCHCNLTFTLNEEIPEPVYVQYKLDGFFQNHRRYVTSRDDEQLLGDWSKKPSTECEPFDYDEGKKIVPCGAIANSLFNDSFQLSNADGVVTLIDTGIAWESDKDGKFKNPSGWISELQDNPGVYTKPPNWSKQLYELDPDDPDNNGLKNEDFIVWMRTASLPNFRKPWRRVDHSKAGFESGLPKGEYSVEIEYNYPVSQFGAKKSLIVTNSSVYGTLNGFLGVAYLVVGAVSMVIAGVFLFLKVKEVKDRTLYR